VVSADGEVLHASESQNPDVFWGLRGGGGNFGIVTEFDFRLHPVGTPALTADLFYRPTDAPQALRRWRDLIPGAPRRATLAALKDRYDPDNIFHLNHNIPAGQPTTGACAAGTHQ
jgi:FAD/FMN-containing dehydrogenase